MTLKTYVYDLTNELGTPLSYLRDTKSHMWIEYEGKLQEFPLFGALVRLYKVYHKDASVIVKHISHQAGIQRITAKTYLKGVEDALH
jgi:hypothetical protein